jgi:cytidylate kinase
MLSQDNFFILTIDGGAASGKSSSARGVAQALDLLHVDTGAHYRALTHALIQSGAQADQPAAIETTLEALRIGTQVTNQDAQLTINGCPPVDSELRSQAVNAQVSHFAALAPVRNKLFHYQRSLAEFARAQKFAGLVMEGRDIGSVIFPDAPYRFFLFADEQTRAKRRHSEGQTDAIAQRDKLDRSRAVAPLTCPSGATQIDTSQRTLAQVIQLIVDHVQTHSAHTKS